MREHRLPEDAFVLSDNEKDSEGYRFYQRNGTIDLWQLPTLFTLARRQVAPIRVTERGIKHIAQNHHKELGTIEDICAFLDSIFSHATILRRAKGRAMFVVVDGTNADKAAVIKLMPSTTGDYYNVETAGYYRKNKWKETEDVIAELSEPTQSDAVSDVSKPKIPQ